MFGRMWDNDDLYEVIVEGWEKSETSQRIPYFINHKSERTCWDHPYFVKIMDELGEMDAVEYAAYRTALKLRHLQKRLKLHHVTLHTVSSVFIQYGYQDGMEAVVGCEELSTLLTQIYSQADTARMAPEDISIHVDLLQNLLLNTYDVKRTGYIRVLSLKLCLACLCTARLSEKYKYFYRQLSDPNFFVGRQMLGTFLLDCLQIPELIHERAAFGGTNITPAVDSCVHMCGLGPGVSEDSFLAWLLKEPQTLVWLPTMHRVAASESVKHDAKCNVCKACPLVGFRYRCLQCFNFDICQTCFFSGRTGKGHKLKHPIQEYCLPTSSKEDTKAFMKTVRNNLSKKHRRKNKPKYLPIDGAEYYGPDEWSQPEQIPDDIHPVVLKKANSLASANSPPQTRSALSPLGQNQVRPANRIVGKKSHALPKINNIDKENLTPYTGLSVPEEDRANLEMMIRNLEEENRHLYKQLAEINTGGENSETESNGSYAEELEEEREVLEAKKEVLEYHNLSLNKQLSRVRQALKTSPSSESYGFFENSDLSVDVTSFASHVSGLSPSLPVVSPLSNQSGSTIPASENTSLEDASPVTIGDLRTPGDENRQINSTERYTCPNLRGDNSSWTPTHFFSPYLIRSGLKPSGSEQRVPNGFTPSGWESVDLIDGDLGQSHFTLPSVSQSQHFPEEEAELDSLVHQIEKAFPADMSYSAYLGGSRSYGVDRDMLGVANRLGDAMTEFVSATGNYSVPS